MWIVLHQLDISSDEYPLVRIKFVFLLLLLPLLLADTALLIFYLGGLEPDIITSCCAVIFEEGQQGGAVQNLLSGQDDQSSLLLYYGWMVFLFATGILAWWRQKNIFYLVYGIAVAVFFVLALNTLVTVLSSYIYAMPFHNCPFCMLKREYCYIGFFIYIPLFIAVFCGVTPMLIEACKAKRALAVTVANLQRKLVALSVATLLIYAALSSYHYIIYVLLGGEG